MLTKTFLFGEDMNNCQGTTPYCLNLSKKSKRNQKYSKFMLNHLHHHHPFILLYHFNPKNLSSLQYL